MKLSLFTIEKWDYEWEYGWSIAIGIIETSHWCGSLLAIGKFDETYQFDLLWLRSLVRKLLGR